MSQDSSRLREWFQRHADELLNFLRRRVDEPDAADLVQDVYVRVLEYGDIAAIREPRAFLFRTAANLAIDHQRRQSHRVGVDDDSVWDSLPTHEPSPEAIAHSRERLARFHAALAELPPLQRHALLLNRFDGLGHAEIAVRLNLSSKTVQRYIAKAMAHCLARVGE